MRKTGHAKLGGGNRHGRSTKKRRRRWLMSSDISILRIGGSPWVDKWELNAKGPNLGCDPAGQRLLRASCAFHEHKDFAVEHAVFGEKLCISFRIDPNRCVRMARFNRSDGLTFVRNADKRPFLQRRCAARIR
jgi:hypothetical protein